VTVDQLRDLNPFAVAYRYDDELIPAISRQSLASTLSIVMAWAGQRTSA
jgi:hypothetical protein